MRARAAIVALVLFMAVAWCVSGADAQTVTFMDMDDWSGGDPHPCSTDGAGDAACSDNGYEWRAIDMTLETGSVCRGAAGKCLATDFGPGYQGTFGMRMDWNGNPTFPDPMSATNVYGSFWLYFNGFDWDGPTATPPTASNIKLSRIYDDDAAPTTHGGATVIILTDGEATPVEYSLSTNDETDGAVSGSMGLNFADEAAVNNAWFKVEFYYDKPNRRQYARVLDASLNVLELLDVTHSTGSSFANTTWASVLFPEFIASSGAEGVAGQIYLDDVCGCTGTLAACQSACAALDGGGGGATCGDGTREGGEACDDGGTTAGDGCSASCTVEEGWSCSGVSPDVCSETCGDGLIVGAEECDDGDTSGGDGCSAACAIEAGWECSGEPSSCSPLPVSPSPVIVGGSISGGRTGQ